MKFACAECICIAIEAHREDLLRELISQMNLEYHDTFWAPKPHVYLRNSSLFSEELIPELHCIRADTSLELIGHENCGHVAIDAELLTPPTETSAYVLVSLITLAMLHTTTKFDPFSILRSSGIETFSPTAIDHHVFRENYAVFLSVWEQTEGPLEGFEYMVPPRQTVKGFEGPLQLTFHPFMYSIEESVSPISKALHLNMLEYNELLVDTVDSGADHVHYSFVSAVEATYYFLNEQRLGLRFWCIVGQLGRLLNYSHSRITTLAELCCLSNEKINVNNLFEERLKLWSIFNKTDYSRDGLIPYLAHDAEFICQLNNVSVEMVVWHAFNLNEVLKRFLRCGFSYFVKGPVPAFEGRYTSFFYLLYCERYANHVEMMDGMSHQLLALGFGRPELHAGRHEAFDARLVYTRQMTQLLNSAGSTERAAKLQQLIDCFDCGPLTLMQLSRIAIRRVLGGSLFEKRVRKLEVALPPLLFRYVSDPTEFMF